MPHLKLEYFINKDGKQSISTFCLFMGVYIRIKNHTKIKTGIQDRFYLPDGRRVMEQVSYRAL